MFNSVEPWGAASFENNAAGDHFLVVEEAPERRSYSGIPDGSQSAVSSAGASGRANR